jgi:hypothetical protein
LRLPELLSSSNIGGKSRLSTDSFTDRLSVGTHQGAEEGKRVDIVQKGSDS